MHRDIVEEKGEQQAEIKGIFLPHVTMNAE